MCFICATEEDLSIPETSPTRDKFLDCTCEVETGKYIKIAPALANDFSKLAFKAVRLTKKASKGREPYRLRKVQTYLYITPLPSPELVGTYDIAWSSQGELDLITGPSIDLW